MHGLLALKKLRGLIEDLDGLIDEAVTPVFFYNEAKGVGRYGQIVSGVHLLEDFPHGLVLFGASECADELFALDDGGVVRGVVGSGPVEETEGFGAGIGAGAEDAVDELGVDGDAHLVECALHVDVTADDVGDVVDGCKVVVFGRFVAIDCGGKGLEVANQEEEVWDSVCVCV